MKGVIRVIVEMKVDLVLLSDSQKMSQSVRNDLLEMLCSTNKGIVEDGHVIEPHLFRREQPSNALEPIVVTCVLVPRKMYESLVQP